MDEKQLQAVPTQPEESALPEDAQDAMKHAQPASPSADGPEAPEAPAGSDEVSSEATEAEENAEPSDSGDAPAPPQPESQADGIAPADDETSPDATGTVYIDEPVAINVAEELAGDREPDEAGGAASTEPAQALDSELEDVSTEPVEARYVDEPISINVAEELAEQGAATGADASAAAESQSEPAAPSEAVPHPGDDAEKQQEDEESAEETSEAPATDEPADPAAEESSSEPAADPLNDEPLSINVAEEMANEEPASNAGESAAVEATDEKSEASDAEIKEPAPDPEVPIEEPEEEAPAPPVNDPSDDPVPADDQAPVDDPVNDEPVSINVAEEMAEETHPPEAAADADATNPEATEETTDAAVDGTDILTGTLDSAAEAGALLGVTESMGADELLGEQEQPIDAAEARQKQLKAVLEAIVYVLNDPMPAAQIAQALNEPLAEVEPILRLLVEETAQADRGVFIREVAGGYQMATKPEHHDVIRQFVKNLKQPLKLSQAALETLAVIAYKQPITLPEILEIRGVQGGGVLKTLLDRKLVTTAGRKNVIGKPMLYKTTKEFLTQFGLRDTAELPSLKEFEEIRRQSMADDEIVAEETEMPEAMREAEAAERAALQESEAQAAGEASSESDQEESPAAEAQATEAAERPEETPAEGSEETEPNHG